MTIVAETFDCTGLNVRQLDIIELATELCDFPWRILKPGLKASTGGRDTIPVAFRDLTTWSAQPAVPVGDGSTDDTAAIQAAIDHGHGHGHSHADRGPDDAHLIEYRARALGLAYYSGKVEIEATLEAEADLAIEVFLAEAAHMVDFFYMTPRHRESLFDIFHGADDDPLAPDTDPHGHGWFEETGNNDYWSWVGEGFMGGFIKAFAPTIDVTLTGFSHTLNADQAQAVRRLLLPTPPTSGSAVHTSTTTSKVVHDTHHGTLRPTSQHFASLAEATAAGYRPCGVCKPA